MNIATFFDFKIDIHHIFPKAWCDKNGIDRDRRESIVNKTAISFSTNRTIGGNRPSTYLHTIEKRSGLTGTALDRVLATHFLDPSKLREDDFDSFFEHRRRALLDLIAEAMGKRPIDDGDEADQWAEAEKFEAEPDEVSDDDLVATET